MKVFVRNVVNWGLEHPREAIGWGGVVVSGFAWAGGMWLALWLNVRDHGATLDAIQAQQAKQETAVVAARKEARDDFRDYAAAQQRWQDKAEARDEAQASQLATIARDLARLTGFVQQTAAQREKQLKRLESRQGQWWRFPLPDAPQATESTN